MCAPQMSLDEFFDGRPGAQRAIHDAIAAHLAGLGPLIVEAVGIGILFKRSRTFAELRPRRDRLVLDFILPRQLDDPRVRRTIVMSASRSAHFVDLRVATDVDDQILGWLAEAYDSSPS